MDKLEQVTEKLQEFREVAKDIVANSCHGALLAKGFVANELVVEPVKTPQRSLASVKSQAKKTSYIEQAAKKKFCVRLTWFAKNTNLF